MHVVDGNCVCDASWIGTILAQPFDMVVFMQGETVLMLEELLPDCQLCREHKKAQWDEESICHYFIQFGGWSSLDGVHLIEINGTKL